MFNLDDNFFARLESARPLAYLCACSGLVSGPVLAMVKLNYALFASADLAKLLLLIFALGAPVLVALAICFLAADMAAAVAGKFDLHRATPAALCFGGILAHVVHAFAIVLFAKGSLTSYAIGLGWLLLGAVGIFAVIAALEGINARRRRRALAPEASH
jgi:hypothetical protein